MDVNGNYLALSYNDNIFEINADNNMLESISDADWNFSWGETSWWKGKDESILKKGAMYANDFSFWRFANHKYLQQFYSHEHDCKEINLYEYITRKYLPPDFHIIQLSYSGCPTLWKLFLVTRGAILHIVLIENISSVPIKVGKFFLRKKINDRLTERKENSI